VGLRRTIPGVKVQATGAGDHLPKLDIRIRRIKEMARAVLNGLDYKLHISFINQLITFCLSRINVMTTRSLTGNWCPRVRMTGRKIDFKREYALIFGDYVEARDPQVVSNSMEPRTEPCIALYPTLNVNGSWKMFNMVSKRLVSRSQFRKATYTPEFIINSMNDMALNKGTVKASDIDGDDGVELEPIVNEPNLLTHAPDPNMVEQIVLIEEEDGPLLEGKDIGQLEEEVEEEVQPLIEEVTLVEEEAVEVQQAPEPTRRSTRTTAGQTSKYEPYSMLTRGYGLACSNLRVKVALERFGKVAYDSIKEELVQLFIKKRALVPMMLREVTRENSILRSHMFLREKYNAVGVFEKIKARLVADGSTQDREDFDDEEISSPTACLESIFNML